MTTNRFPDLGTIIAAVACAFLGVLLFSASDTNPEPGFQLDGRAFLGLLMGAAMIVLAVLIILKHKKF